MHEDQKLDEDWGPFSTEDLNEDQPFALEKPTQELKPKILGSRLEKKEEPKALPELPYIINIPQKGEAADPKSLPKGEKFLPFTSVSPEPQPQEAATA